MLVSIIEAHHSLRSGLNFNDISLTLLSLERSKARHKTTSLIAVSRVLGVHNTLAATDESKVMVSRNSQVHFFFILPHQSSEDILVLTEGP